MKNSDHPWIGVDNIIRNEAGEFLLMKRDSGARAFPGCWGLVSGFVEWGETCEEALKREAMEEVGVEIEVVSFVGKYYDKKNRHPTKTVICLPHVCRIVSGVPGAVSECSDVGWFSLDEVRKLDMAYDHKQMILDLVRDRL